MDLLTGVLALVILIYSAILHEIAHGFVAERLGDPTARLLGRLTLNPKSHIDPVMTILFPIITFFGSGGTLIFGAANRFRLILLISVTAEKTWQLFLWQGLEPMF